MVQVIHDSIRQNVRIYVAEYDSSQTLTVKLTNILTEEYTTQPATIENTNTRRVHFLINTTGLEVGMYVMDLSQGVKDLGRHLAYLRYDEENALPDLPYNDYKPTTNPDVVYNG